MGNHRSESFTYFSRYLDLPSSITNLPELAGLPPALVGGRSSLNGFRPEIGSSGSLWPKLSAIEVRREPLSSTCSSSTALVLAPPMRSTLTPAFSSSCSYLLSLASRTSSGERRFRLLGGAGSRYTHSARDLIQAEQGVSLEHFTFRCWQRTHACDFVPPPAAEAGDAEEFMDSIFTHTVIP